jgi:hypothetical protein
MDFDIDDIEVEDQYKGIIPAQIVRYYKILAETDKVLANVFVTERADGRQIEIYWNSQFITLEGNSSIIADIRELIPGYKHEKAGTTVQEYVSEIKYKYDIKTGVEYNPVFHNIV